MGGNGPSKQMQTVPSLRRLSGDFGKPSIISCHPLHLLLVKCPSCLHSTTTTKSNTHTHKITKTKHEAVGRLHRDLSLATPIHTSVPCPCLIGRMVETPGLTWANQILPTRKLKTRAQRAQAVGAHGIHCPGDKTQDNLQ